MKKSKPEVVRTHLETIVDLMSTAVFLLLFIVGFYALFDIHFIQVSARMDEEIASLAPDDAGIDIAALQEINPEIQAWRAGACGLIQRTLWI